MKIGFIGDIVGKPGRKAVEAWLVPLIAEHGLDLVIANGENLTHGTGISMETVTQVRKAGVHILTGGNHTFDKKEGLALVSDPTILRPLNFPRGVPGGGVWTGCVVDEVVRVVSLAATSALNGLNNPFEALETLLEEPFDGVTLVDFHAEYTAEKRAMFLAYRSRLSALLGTHTHIGTDDLEIVDGTAYVTDVGLTGCSDNVIGMELEASLRRQRFALAGGMKMQDECRTLLQMIVMEFDGTRCVKAYKIKRTKEGARITQEAGI